MSGKSYSVDLRRRIVAAYERGEGSYKEIADRFSVGYATVSRLLRLRRETGNVVPRPPGGGFPPRIGPDDFDEFLDLLASMPDATAPELTVAWKKRTGRPISRSSMLRALRRFGFTRKKSPSEHWSRTEKT